MNQKRPELERLERAILARAQRRGLTTSLDGLRYSSRYVFGQQRGRENERAHHALYVGIGHGLDALLALADGKVEHATGVDPFVAEHGNDEDDYETLNELILQLDLKKRFTVIKGIIQEFAPKPEVSPDLIIINDVLHHIFETDEPLRQSALFQDTVEMFSELRRIAKPGGKLVIGDVSRTGLRPLLGRLGVLHAWIDYTTKQNWREWDAAARQAGWSRTGISNYTPYRLRKFAPLFAGSIVRHSLCDKYYLYYHS